MKENIQIIKYYFAYSTKKKILTILCLFLTIFFTLLSTSNPISTTYYQLNGYEYSANSKVQLDITAISDCVYQSDGKNYYIVTDLSLNDVNDNYYYYIVVISDDTFAELATQYEYFYSEELISYAESYQLKGIVRSIDEEVISAFCTAFELTETEFTLYFGSTYLDAVNTTNYFSYVYLFLEIVLFIALIILISEWISHNSAINKAIKYLKENNEIDNAGSQLGNSTSDNNDFIITDDYLFVKAETTIVNISNLKLVNIQKGKKEILVGYDEKQNIVIISTNNKLFEQIINELKAKNPNLQIGFANE